MTLWDRCLPPQHYSKVERSSDRSAPALNTNSAENGSVTLLPPPPRGVRKGEGNFLKCGRVPSFKMKHLTLEGFHIFFSVSSLSPKKQICALICVLHFSPLPFLLSSSQAVSINKAINTQEVAVKEKHARNILILSVCETVRGRSVFIQISMCGLRVIQCRIRTTNLLKPCSSTWGPTAELILSRVELNLDAHTKRSVVLYSHLLF